jgi:hypothetical protein
MEDLGQEVALRWFGREVRVDNEFAPENSSLEWSILWPDDVCLHVHNIAVLVRMENDT